MTIDPQVIYLLHFEQPIGHCRHYIGRSTLGNIEARLARHSAGHAARLTSIAAAKGIGFVLGNLWITPDREAERTFKTRWPSKKLCTTCTGRFPAEANHLIGRRWSPRPQGTNWCGLSWQSELEVRDPAKP